MSFEEFLRRYLDPIPGLIAFLLFLAFWGLTHRPAVGVLVGGGYYAIRLPRG
jgi:hypothetical protein